MNRVQHVTSVQPPDCKKKGVADCAQVKAAVGGHEAVPNERLHVRQRRLRLAIVCRTFRDPGTCLHMRDIGAAPTTSSKLEQPIAPEDHFCRGGVVAEVGAGVLL